MREIKPLVSISLAMVVALSLSPYWMSYAQGIESVQKAILPASSPLPPDETYIARIFEAQIGEAPRMGWLFPEHGFVAAEDHPKVALYGAIGTSLEGTKSGQTNDEDRSFLRNRYGEACRVGEMESLFAYDIQGPTEAGRIMFTAKRLPGEMRSGMITVPMAVSDIAAVNKLLGWGDSGVLRRDEAIAVRRQSFWYSFHRLYDSKTGKLIQEASVLHDKDGKLLAREQFADLSDGMCDSCSVPRYVDGMSYAYQLMNMFELPGFPYPVLLLDSSTVEGRAISFRTFMPNGQAAELRDYEYVVHCGA